MQRPTAAECSTGEVPWIEAAEQAHPPNQVGHFGVDNRRDTGRRLQQVKAKLAREPANRLFCEVVVQKDDEVALAGALDSVVGDPALRSALGDANRARCEQEFEEDLCLGRYVDAYAAAVGR